MANGILDDNKAEIERLENLLSQLQLGIQRTGSGAAGGEDNLSMLADLQAQQAAAQAQLAGLTGGPQAGAQATAQGILMNQQLGELEQQQQAAAQPPPQQGPTSVPVPQAPPQPPFQPTMSPDMLQQLYGALAAGADDPVAVGQGYAQRMQYNDLLRNQYLQQAKSLTDAQRPRPVGGGYMDKEGYQVIPIWDPVNGRITEQRLSQRFPDTFKIGDMQYIRNPMQPDISAPNAFIPATDPRLAGDIQGRYREQVIIGEGTGMSRKDAEELTANMATTDARIRSVLNDPRFSAAVGPLDVMSGATVGRLFGTEDAAMTRQVRMLANDLATVKVADWKGAISDAELRFFKSSVPSPWDHPNVWQQWYDTVYVPTMQFAGMRARGEINFTNSNLSDFLESGGWQTGVTPGVGTNPYQELLDDPEVQKLLNPQE